MTFRFFRDRSEAAGLLMRTREQHHWRFGILSSKVFMEFLCLSEEQFPQFETQHPLRRLTQVLGKRVSVKTKKSNVENPTP